jgi:hypothetical protein
MRTVDGRAQFSGHAVVPSLYRDMAQPATFNSMIDVAYIFTFVVTMLFAALGYLMFGNDVSSEITRDLAKTPGYPVALNKLAVWMVAVSRRLFSLLLAGLVPPRGPGCMCRATSLIANESIGFADQPARQVRHREQAPRPDVRTPRQQRLAHGSTTLGRVRKRRHHDGLFDPERPSPFSRRSSSRPHPALRSLPPLAHVRMRRTRDLDPRV